MKNLEKFRDNQGATLAEYAIILSVVLIGALAALGNLTSNIVNVFLNIL